MTKEKELLKKQITVKIAYPPEGKGPGAVIDQNGDRWKFWGTDFKASDFVTGATYDIGYDPGVYNGKPSNTIKVSQNVTGSQLPAPSAAPAPATNGNGHSDHRDRNIFICGVVNQGIAAGKIDPFSAIDLTNVRKAATAAFEACP